MSNTTTDINYSQNPIINDQYNKIVNSMDSTKFTQIETSENPTVKLSKFYYNTFTVGNTNAFETLSNEYANSLNAETQKMDNYIATAQKAKAAIEAAIAQDQKAHADAVAAREATGASYPAYQAQYDTKGNLTYSKSDYEKDKQDAMDKAYNATWEKECWKPGK